MSALFSISEVNSMDGSQFEAVFGNVIELCPDAAVQVRKQRPFQSVEDLCAAFSLYLDQLSKDGKLVILKLHPDLAGKLASQGELTKESTSEQQQAGLHELTEYQRLMINQGNQRYKEKFRFPFIICARENKAKSIIEGLKRRYNNTVEQEILTGIDEVKKICKLRILDIVKEN